MTQTNLSWVWAILCALTAFYGFVLPGSDTAAGALSLCALVAMVAVAAWVWPVPEQPALLSRRPVRWVIGAALLLVCALSVLPLITLLTGKAGGYGGLYDPSGAWLEYIKLAGVFCAFGLGFRAAMTAEAAKHTLDALLIMAGVWALVCIIMHIMDPDGIYGAVKMGAGRLTGAFSSPNSAGTLFGAVAVLAFGRLMARYYGLRGRPYIERIDPLFLTIGLLSLAALALTLSRGAIAATGVALVVTGLAVMVAGGRRLSARASLTVGAVVLLVLVGLFATPLKAVIERFYNLEGDLAVRAGIFHAHYEVASKQPGFGFGLGSFNAVNNTILSESTYRDMSVIRAAHNVYLQWLEETGFVGVLALGGLNAAILIPFGRAILRRKPVAVYLTAIAGGYLVFLLHGLTDYGFQEPALSVFMALLLGCGLAMATNHTAPK